MHIEDSLKQVTRYSSVSLKETDNITHKEFSMPQDSSLYVTRAVAYHMVQNILRWFLPMMRICHIAMFNKMLEELCDDVFAYVP